MQTYASNKSAIKWPSGLLWCQFFNELVFLIENVQTFIHFSESDKGKEGCETIYACCQRDLKSEGCKQVCKKCGLEWGSKANECYSTTLNPHDLERVVHSV